MLDLIVVLSKMFISMYTMFAVSCPILYLISYKWITLLYISIAAIGFIVYA